MKRLFLAVLYLACVAARAQDDISVRVALEPPLIPFHRYATYTVTVEAPATAVVRFDSMLEKFGGLQVTSGPDHRTVPIDNDRIRTSESYRIEGVLPEDYFIDPAFVNVNDRQYSVASPALRVRTLTPEEEEEAEQFAGIIDPPPVRPEWYRDWRYWSLAAIVAVLLVGLGRSLRKRTPHVEPVVAPVPPWEVAYRRLRELDMRELPKAGKFGTFYVDLSSILRYYIEDRFHLHAPEQTTPEFLLAMSESGTLDDDHQRFLARFLRLSDHVKFAQYRPRVDEMDQSFVEVLKFVDDTVPKPEASAQEAAA